MIPALPQNDGGVPALIATITRSPGLARRCGTDRVQQIVTRLTGELATLIERINNAKRRSSEAARMADAAQTNVEQSAAALDGEWAAVLASRDHLDAERQTVEALRPLAERLPQFGARPG